VDKDLGSGVPLHLASRPSRYDIDERSTELLLNTYTWTAPSTGVFVISNAGSGSTSQLRVRSGGCNGAEVPRAGEAHAYALQAGEKVFLTLLGEIGRYGWTPSAFQLHITEATAEGPGLRGDRLDNDGNGWMDCQDPRCAPTPECGVEACADVNLGSTLPAQGSTARYISYDLFQPRCGVGDRDEDVYLWTAPKDGEYVFHGNTGGYTIALRASCTAEAELACARRDYMPWGIQEHPVLVRSLRAGESVLVIVEGYQNDAGQPMARPDRVFVHERGPENDLGLCSDGRDNDGDMRIDAYDSDCPNSNGW
jgi:hypothetical protein